MAKNSHSLSYFWSFWHVFFRFFAVSDTVMLTLGAFSTWTFLTHMGSRFQAIFGPLSHTSMARGPENGPLYGKMAPNGGLVPGQRNPPGNWLLNGPYGKNSPWVHVKKMGLSNTRYSKYPMNLVRIGYWKLFWIWVGYRVLVGHCSQPVFETDQLLLYVNFPFIFFAFEKYVWSLPTSVIPIPTVAANILTLI